MLKDDIMRNIKKRFEKKNQKINQKNGYNMSENQMN